ncbi:MAG: fibronectin type III domain-containing protein [Candidatus Eisenbacteria sp.]|nr:fibronectin type III domain-containing protein [Candidatus Eisenbacteria bacterium]
MSLVRPAPRGRPDHQTRPPRNPLLLPLALILGGMLMGFLPGSVTSASGQVETEAGGQVETETGGQVETEAGRRAEGAAGDAVPQTAPPPPEIEARDTPSDRGENITVTWTPPPEDTGVGGPVFGYRIERGLSPEGPFEHIGQASPGATRYDDTNVADGLPYYYRVITLTASAEGTSGIGGPAIAAPQWINTNQWNVFIVLALLLGFNLYFIEHIKAGGKPFIRKIAGLEAINEAVGRATEMGRPILFVPGIQDMNDIQTVAGVTILSYIARTVAEYDSRLVVPTSRALVMTTARETVKEAFLAAGRPESYDESSIYYITDEQFGYVAGVNGYMVREKPATCFYMGAFFAESLILAETGNSIGAIQVAGTAMPAQLPFFVAACDYTLIGEELFAASAYLSGEPKQLGSIKGQDVGKFIGMLSVAVGVLVLSIAMITGWDPLVRVAEWIRIFWSTELA